MGSVRGCATIQSTGNLQFVKADEQCSACQHCKGVYKKQLISVHAKHCSQSPGTSSCPKRGAAARLGRLMPPIPLDTESVFYHRVLAKQRDDEISSIIRAVPLILEYGKRLFDRIKIPFKKYSPFPLDVQGQCNFWCNCWLAR